jgi:hypothetical protein
MDAEGANAEIVREFFGLSIVAAWMLICAWVTARCRAV